MFSLLGFQPPCSRALGPKVLHKIIFFFSKKQVFWSKKKKLVVGGGGNLGKLENLGSLVVALSLNTSSLREGH